MTALLVVATVLVVLFGSLGLAIVTVKAVDWWWDRRNRRKWQRHNLLPGSTLSYGGWKRYHGLNDNPHIVSSREELARWIEGVGNRVIVGPPPDRRPPPPPPPPPSPVPGRRQTVNEPPLVYDPPPSPLDEHALEIWRKRQPQEPAVLPEPARIEPNDCSRCRCYGEYCGHEGDR